MENREQIPRRLWLMWHQGLQRAPFIVKECVESWVSKNPSWDVVVLDSENVQNYVEIECPSSIFTKLELCHQSDLIRLALLSEYGGVWADATTFCRKPLDDWIDEYASSGFFVFDRPGKDRILSNWFIATKRNCPICTRLYRELARYLIDNDFPKPNMLRRYLSKLTSIVLGRRHQTTRYWFSPIVTKVFRIYPYFYFHYMFEKVIRENEEPAALWAHTKKVSAYLPHSVQRIGMFAAATPSVKAEIDGVDTPLFKLTWKCNAENPKSGTLLHYVFREMSNGID